MLTEEGCRARRNRLWEIIDRNVEWIVVTEPRHLTYFANFTPSPFVFNSQGAAAALILGRDGAAILVADNVQEPFVSQAFATEKISPVWYRCVESAGHRAQLLVQTVRERLQACAGRTFGYESTSCPAGLVEGLARDRPHAKLADIDLVVSKMRRAKLTDEIAMIRRSLAAASAALRAAMAELRPGMTELDAYRLVERVAGEAAG